MIEIKRISLTDNVDWTKLINNSNTATFFQTKEWLQMWMKHWGIKGKEEIYAVFDNENLIAIAPFYKAEDKINFLGVPDPSKPASLSDFGDIIAKISYEEIIWREVLANIKNQKPLPRRQAGKIKNTDEKLDIELNYIREESPSLQVLRKLGGRVEEMGVSPVIYLPKSWEEYLNTFDRHDRHEMRRKMRKNEYEGVEFVKNEVSEKGINDLFEMMAKSDKNKANFLDGNIKKFLQDAITSIGGKSTLRLSFLRYNDINIAGTIIFLWKNNVLLYNSGFDPKFNYLSPGQVLNLYVLKNAIEEGMTGFDFLRGNEEYKFKLGARERKLYKVKFE